MERKRTLAAIVKNTIESYPYIRSSLTEGLVNYSALARKLKNDIDSEMQSGVSEESLVVSIKRYADNLQKPETGLDIPEIISDATISTTEDIAFLLLESKEKNLEKIHDVLQNSEWNLDEIKLIMQAGSRVFVVLNKDKMREFVEQINEEDMMLNTEVAMLSIKIPTGHFNVFGLVNEFTKVLAKKGINIEKLVTLAPNIYFIIDEEKLNDALESIKGLIKNSKEIVKHRKVI